AVPVLLPPRCRARGGACASPAGPHDRGAGRGLDGEPGAHLPRGRGRVPLRHSHTLAGRGRGRQGAAPGDDRPDPVPTTGRSADVRTPGEDRRAWWQRLHGRRRPARRAAARTGCGAPDPHPRGPGHGRRARPAPVDGPLRRVPARGDAAAVAHLGSGHGARGAAASRGYLSTPAPEPGRRPSSCPAGQAGGTVTAQTARSTATTLPRISAWSPRIGAKAG